MDKPYGSKLDIEKFAFEIGGGGLNTALNFKNLGFNTATIVKIGEDPMAEAIMETVKKHGVEDKYIVVSKKEHSGLSVILISFQGDRTVLAHRGTNATLKSEEIDFDAIKKAKWLYLAPLNGDSTKALNDIAMFAEEHDVNLSINVGTSSIKNSSNNLPAVLKTAEIVIMNLEEAQMLTHKSVRPNSSKENFDNCFIHPDILSIIDEVKTMAGGVVVITDGKQGAYAYDGKKYYKCGEFPAKVVSTLGAGDAFASTFTAVLSKTNDIKKSLMYASVNAASVVGVFSAQKGFLNFGEIESRLKQNPNFIAEEFCL